MSGEKVTMATATWGCLPLPAGPFGALRRENGTCCILQRAKLPGQAGNGFKLAGPPHVIIHTYIRSVDAQKALARRAHWLPLKNPVASLAACLVGERLRSKSRSVSSSPAAGSTCSRMGRLLVGTYTNGTCARGPLVPTRHYAGLQELDKIRPASLAHARDSWLRPGALGQSEAILLSPGPPPQLATYGDFASAYKPPRRSIQHWLRSATADD